MNLKKQNGITLTQLMIGMSISMLIILLTATAYQKMNSSYKKNTNDLEKNTNVLLVNNIFRKAINTAGIPSIYGFYPWQQKITPNSQNRAFFSLNLPTIFAQKLPLDSITLSEAEPNTDALIIQGVGSFEYLKGSLSASSESIATSLKFSKSRYILLGDQEKYKLVEAKSNSGKGFVSIENPLGTSFATNSFIANDYYIKILYIRANGKKDIDNKPIYSLYQSLIIGSKKLQTNELISNVSDLKIDYYYNNSWNRVDNLASSSNVNIWYNDVKGLRFDYKMSGISYQNTIMIPGANL